MKKITLLLTQHYRPMSVAAILDVFQTVNSFYLQRGEEPFFSITVASLDEKLVFPVQVQVPLETVSCPDLILIPAFASGPLSDFVQCNQALIPWLQKQYRQGSEIASFCTGIFLLAATGLLKGREATTHVLAAQDFARCFPDVVLQSDKVATDDGGVYTSGGATSSFHLMLHLLEKYCGREIAIQTAKLFAIDMDRVRQSHFSSFSPRKQHGDNLISEAQQRIERRFQEAVTIDELTKDLPMCRRNFIRRFKSATGLTPIEYLQRTRMEEAKKLLEKSDYSISEVMVQSGYNDAKAFRQVFRRMVGLTPSIYREKYRGKKQEVVNAIL